MPKILLPAMEGDDDTRYFTPAMEYQYHPVHTQKRGQHCPQKGQRVILITGARNWHLWVCSKTEKLLIVIGRARFDMHFDGLKL